MLTVKDTSGTALENVELNISGNVKGGSVSVDVTVNEDDVSLASQYVSATLDWNDGSQEVSFAAQTQPLSISVSKFLKPGFYVIKLTARNYRNPTHDEVVVKFLANITSGVLPSNPPEIIFGPILPRDQGAPSPATWNLDTGSDILILESSVKSILATAKGERVMVPDFGTDVRRLLFDLNARAVESLVEEEIVNAFSVWEPRVRVEGIDIERDIEGRSITVYLALLSLISQQPFQVNVSFVR